MAAIAATVAAGGPAAAQNFRKSLTADQASALRLAEGQATESRSTKVYVVQMAAKPGISYKGGAADFARTAPEAGAKYDARSSQAQMYTEHLVAQQDSLLASIGAGSRKIYSYRHALNGFAARLTAGEAATLKKNKAVLNVWEDRKMRVDTNNSPQFLGLLDPKNGLRTKHGLRGKGIIIGMLDTGAVQEHPSFDDTGFDPPANWNGICQAGEGWSANDCNNKLIGARYFISGFGAGNVVPGEFQSARDSDGHGTHTATTAGGREVTASLAGTPLAQISGMAPDTYVAIYKVCWAAPNPDDSG
ncbi:MAG: S8 family serine peptidase, partial [Opitutaceae bacterium]